MENKLYFLASDISVSEEQRESSDIFLFIRMRILDTCPNGNNESVTEAFIDEIIANPDKYACLALYADLPKLLAGQFEKLGHLFNRDTGKFFTQQVGAITNFEKVQDEYGCSLLGEARIPKRQTQTCERIMELYNLGMLNFSFEIRYIREATIEENGVTYVDANENNALTGVAIVSVPAYPESTALQMVAENEEATNEVNKMTLEEALALIAQKDEELANKDQMIAERDATIAERDEKIAELDAAIAAKKEDSCGEEEEEKKEEPTEEATAEATEEEKEDDTEEKDHASAELQEEIDRLRAELETTSAELKLFKDEKAAHELAAAQTKIKAFAEKQGLNPEDENVSKAIAELDYKAIAEMSMDVKEEETAEVPTTVVASLVGDGFELKAGKYDDLLAPSKN